MWAMETFGEKFRKARNRAGLSQDDVGAACKNNDGEPLSRSAISQWEHDEAKPTFDNLVAALKLLNASADEVLGLSRTENQQAGNVLLKTHLLMISRVVEKFLLRRYPLTLDEKVTIIGRIYNTFPHSGKLSTAQVLQLMRPQYEGIIHGRKHRKGNGKGNQKFDR